jgi:PEGA domain-containing protein
MWIRGFCPARGRPWGAPAGAGVLLQRFDLGGMMNRIYRLAGVLACAASLSACATVTRGTRQNYVIETDPPGAQIALSTGQTCTSPCTLRLKRKAGFTVTATREGYEPATANVVSRLRGGGGAALAGNLLIGGLIGGGIDAATGATNDLRPNPLRIAMVPIGGTVAATAAEGSTAPAEAPAAEAPPADAPAAEAAPEAEAAPAPEAAPQGE